MITKTKVLGTATFTTNDGNNINIIKLANKIPTVVVLPNGEEQEGFTNHVPRAALNNYDGTRDITINSELCELENGHHYYKHTVVADN